MATFNSAPNVLNNCVKSTESLQSTAAFFAASPSPVVGLNSSTFAATASAVENHSYIGIQKNLPSVTHHVNSSSYTFMEIKSEPCQVSEVTTSNSLQSNNQHNSESTSSTMTAMVKIESASPKMSEMEKAVSQMNQTNSVPLGVTVGRKRLQETTLHTTAIQQSPRDMNYFGIRVADIGGVGTAACGSIYFTGADLIPGTSTEDINSGINNMNRSTFWQYPNTFPIESVISMSPVGLQYSRDASRGQLVLLPTTATVDSFQQAAFLWPPYMQQNSAGTLQSPPNFIFPSISPQTSGQSQSFTAPLQLLGSNYLTAAAAAATSTLCQHSQTNGNRFVPISSDTKRIEQSQKHDIMKIEDCSDHNSLSRSNFISRNARIDRSKVESESNYLEMQANLNLVGAPPMLPHEQSHILLRNTPSPSEFINMSFNQPNFMRSPETIPLTPVEMSQEVVGEMYKNSVLRFSSFPKTPEMQDVNIQTDTPVCSEDENSSLDVSAAETMSCNVQGSEINKSASNLTPNQCHNNYSGCTALLKENFEELLQLHPTSNDYSKENTALAAIETCSLQSDFMSNTSISKNESFNSDSLIILPSVDRCENSSFKVTNPPLIEMSGLELLSNISTGSFVNHNSLKTHCVKKEPCDIIENERSNTPLNNYETYAISRGNLNTQYSCPTDQSSMQNTIYPSTQSSESSLGGLNLLCALAEQRIQEEVADNNSVNERNLKIKRRRHKHSKTKSSKKSRYYKKNKKKHAKERKEYFKAAGMKSDCGDVHQNLKSVFKKVDPNYKKLSKWPNPEDFFKAMESDMRMRLADITRQYKKKKKKLDEIRKIKKNKKGSSSEYKFANISCKNPNFICFLDKFQSTSSNFPPPMEVSKNQNITLHNKINSVCAPDTSEHYEEQSTFTDGVLPSKLNSGAPSHNSNSVEKLCCKENKDKKKRRQSSGVNRNAVVSKSLALECQQQTMQIKTDGKRAAEIDKGLILSNEHLYRKETRVLTDMGGLFYAGILKPLQPPDVYAITLDGERGNKSHIMSREEIFKDTILEVTPKNIEDVPTGTRLCAYWSQQYRCLYPGKAIESEITDIGSDFVCVEFDDGDSGRIRLQNIRFLFSDYPIVDSQNIDDRVKRAYVAFYACKKAFGNTWGFKLAVVYWLYTAIVRPILTYGSLVWWKVVENQYQLSNFTKIQRLACIGVMGSLRTTPMAATETMLSLIPLDLYCSNTAAKSAFRLREAGLWSPVPYGHASILSRWGAPYRYAATDYITSMLAFDRRFTIRWKNKQVTRDGELAFYTASSKMDIGVLAGVY